MIKKEVPQMKEMYTNDMLRLTFFAPSVFYNDAGLTALYRSVGQFSSVEVSKNLTIELPMLSYLPTIPESVHV